MTVASKPVVHGPWKRGMDNVSLDHAVAKDALRTAVNVDVLDDGTVRRRPGTTLRVAGAAHSVWSDGQALYAVVDGVLTRYTRAVSGALSGTPLRSGLSPDLPVAYAEVAGEVYYSNNSLTGKIVAGVHRPWGVERPSGQPALAALANGALYAGRFQVAATFVDNRGEESGTGATAAVSVAAGGGIRLAKIPQPVDPSVSRIRIYVSEANGAVPYRYADVAVGTTTLDIARSSTLGKALDTQFLMPPVPGTSLESFHGRIYVGRSNLVFFTEPHRYGAMKQANYLAFEGEVRIIKGTDAGLWIATASETLFLEGSGPEDFRPRERLAYGAASGAVTDLPGGKLFWMSAQGPVVCNNQGFEIEDLTDDDGEPLARIATNEHTRGSAVVREQDGVRQIIAAMDGGANSTLASQDFFDIEIIRQA
ncbi:MAG: hypothetical protein ACREXU_03385 [Gammaproteobacteria bacterium]